MRHQMDNNSHDRDAQAGVIEQQFEALATLTQRLEQQQIDRDALIEQTEAAVLAEAAQRSDRQQMQYDQERAALRLARDEAQSRAADLEHEIATLLNSTSWKLMGPARKIILALRRLSS